MIYELIQGRFSRRWSIYEIGHTEDDREWIASFRYENMARAYMESLQNERDNFWGARMGAPDHDRA